MNTACLRHRPMQGQTTWPRPGSGVPVLPCVFKERNTDAVPDEVELIGGPENRFIVLVDFDEAWSARYDTEQEKIALALRCRASYGACGIDLSARNLLQADHRHPGCGARSRRRRVLSGAP